ncbi:MAG: selenocysteine-specific translation elongation factor [Vicinamibacterales bacterium]
MGHIVIGTAGHIDHGKSTLVHALSGIDPDRLKEEKARGITIELGFAHAAIDGETVSFVDVPGHERFVRTMLAGAGGIDAVLLVVAADEAVMPQTREHFEICRLLRVKRGLVALTKADLVDEETLTLARLDVAELVAGSFLDGAPVLAVSARTGQGLAELGSALVALGHGAAARPSDGPARLPVDRAFTMAGFGTVVTGTLVSGRVRVDDELLLVPGDRRARVRGIQVHGRREDKAVAGQRTAINLGGVDLDQVERGMTLAAPGSLVETRRVDALVELLPGAKPLRHGARVRVHQGTREVMARVGLIGPQAATLEPGTQAPARIRLEAPLALTRGDRLILRAYSPLSTIGGGSVLDPAPPRAGVRTAAGLARAAALTPRGEADDDRRAAARMIADAGREGLARAALVPRAGMAPGRVGALVAALEQAGEAETAGDRLVEPGVLAGLAGQLVALVAAHHKAEPLAEGLPREEARARISAGGEAVVFEAVLARLVQAGTIVARDRLALATHRVELDAGDAKAQEAIARAYLEGGLAPPDARQVAEAAGVTPAVAETLTALLVRRKVVVRLGGQVFHADALEALKAGVQALKASAPGGQATLDVAAFKERYGVTRKFAIPLLEWLDRERVTRRVGDARLVL